MNEEIQASVIASKIASEAAQIAAKVSSEAALVARDVASKASENSAKLADAAFETQKTVLLLGSDVGYLKRDVSEIKTEIKEQGNVLDEIAKNYQQLGGITVMLADANKRDNKFDERLESIEKWRAYVTGFVGILTLIVVPMAVIVFQAWITKHF